MTADELETAPLKGGVAKIEDQTTPTSESPGLSVSSILDIWKGLFVPFMLTEHTRSSLHVSGAAGFLLFVSQVACALDMTSFSTAYGFVCHAQYFANSTRSWQATLGRMLRSVLLIYCCGVVMNVFFAFQVLGQPPSASLVLKIFSLRVIYWDFIYTFIFLLVLGLVITCPLLLLVQHVRASREPNDILSLVLQFSVFAALLCAPLCFATERFNVDCTTASGRAKALFLGCTAMEFTATRFPAVPYFFFFNLGCIASFAHKDLLGVSASEGGRTGAGWLTRAGCYAALLVALLSVELHFAAPLLRNAKVSWEELTPDQIPGYRRYPLNFRLALGWALLSFCALLLATAIHWGSAWLGFVFERLGANVLLHLTMNALMIHGFFGMHYWRLDKNEENLTAIVLATSLLTILATQLLIYLARTARK